MDTHNQDNSIAKRQKLSHKLETYAQPYGAQRPLSTRIRVLFGLYPGGKEKSYSLLYQQRLTAILAVCPQSFRAANNNPTPTRIDLEAYARNQPLRHLDEAAVRRAIDAYCFQFYLTDALVHRASIPPPINPASFHRPARGGARAGCELWIQATPATVETAPPFLRAGYGLVYREIIARLDNGALACLEMNGTEVSRELTKPLHYLALCVWRSSRFDPHHRDHFVELLKQADREFCAAAPMDPGRCMGRKGLFGRGWAKLRGR